ncbi:DNA repair protein complementing XP-C cells homolog [Ochlerotatus camptorhynchus]|uniref:DNA repair protein complementing XP-C cells homolog n=1 Tax=Ochlerotatus camptorhynchus TaxID=644619 RepID=UPI0031E37558
MHSSPRKLSLRAKIFSRLPPGAESRNEPGSVRDVSANSDATALADMEEPGDPFASCESLDSDGSSSVGDHLVHFEGIDLDSQFFSQDFQCTATVTEDDRAERDSKPEIAAFSNSGSESDADEKEQINLMLTQLVDYERRHGEARNIIQNYDFKPEEFDKIALREIKEDIAGVINKAENLINVEDVDMPSMKEPAIDEEWQHVEVFSGDEGKHVEVEVVVSQQTTKAGKVIDIDAQLRRLLQSEKREKHLQLHKVHLLCLLGNGFYLNKLINNIVNDNCQQIIEILEHFDIETPEETELKYLSTICDIYRSISKILETSRAIFKGCETSLILLLLAILRFLSIEARLVRHLNVLPKNPMLTKVKLCALTTQSQNSNKPTQAGSIPTERYRNVPLTTAEILKQKPEFANFSQLPQVDGADDCIGEKRLRLDLSTDPKPNLWKLKLKTPMTMHSKLKTKSSQTTSRFFKQPEKLPRAKKKLAKKPAEDKHPIQSVETLTHWIEVYLPAESRWVTVDILSGRVDCLDHVVQQQLPQPVAYVFGWSNDGSLQDVSGRYWWQNETGSRRLRVADKWLKVLTQSYGRRHRKVMQDLLDERDFRRLRFRAPIPEKISDFKNHPSYCLKRDLLKFQAIYPADAPPLGFFRDEPIYARECVHTLHSREVWLRHAKVIRLYEPPYKVVMSKLKREKTELELFGYWQTEDYVPPKASGGRVPRNAYGNIELFKDCMLPEGTVHLKQTNISKTCRRLKVDYAIAVVGFGIHAGGNHPVFEGIVICQEFEQLVLDEYERDQLEQDMRIHEKKEKRIYDNWRKLIRGLLIRNKLRNKYNFGDM